MKFGTLSAALLVAPAEATRKYVHSSSKVLDRPVHRQHLHHLRAETQNKLGNLVVIGSDSVATGAELGNENCPCIGFDNVVGETKAVVGQGDRDIVVTYPGDLGASCTAWDDKNHPFCLVEGSKQDFCEQKWCYVDPKNCDIPVMPKVSAYQPKARFQTMPLYFSYATCDAKDTFTSKDQIPQVGSAGCRCIGLSDSPGMTLATIGDKQVEYPAEIGGQCKPWDAGHHPECVGEGAPSWCEKNWCFVDPCSCDAAVPPKISAYLGDATYQGKPVFWSYATCGEKDTYSEKGMLEKAVKKAKKLCKAEEEKSNKAVLGSTDCPCIGFDGIDGETMATVKHSGMTVEVSYPADLGGSCDAWDEDSNPTCKGDDPAAWCNDKWCYVDPKNCHLPTLPKASSYQPKASYQSLPLYYSYSTCGATDSWTKNAPNVGVSGCRCIGIDGMPGKITTQIEGKIVDYPAEMGGKCKAWDKSNHPSCKGQKPGKAPKWCAKQWCYVDPCSCDIDVPPKTASFLGDATFQGKTVFWSYSTCGETDDYSTKEHQKESKVEIKRLCSGEGVVENPKAKKAESNRRRAPAKSDASGLTPFCAIAVVGISLVM